MYTKLNSCLYILLENTASSNSTKKSAHALPGTKQKEVENIVQTPRKYTVELGKT